MLLCNNIFFDSFNFYNCCFFMVTLSLSPKENAVAVSFFLLIEITMF